MDADFYRVLQDHDLQVICNDLIQNFISQKKDCLHCFQINHVVILQYFGLFYLGCSFGKITL